MDEGKIFEKQVLDLARYLWPESEVNGSIMFNGKERDGVFITDDVIHLIEATISRTASKVDYDTKKLIELKKEYENRYSDKLIKCWIITKSEPTADQRSIAERYKVFICSIEAYQSRLFNATEYLLKRDKHSFGSVRDPNTDNFKFEDTYIPTNLIEKNQSVSLPISALSNELTNNNSKYVILGHFGVGKSLTCYEVYKRMRSSFIKNKTRKFPVFLNLREHDGQKNPSEALMRHATNIGFDRPNALVYAWKLGYINLILDGIDEMSPFSWADHPSKLKQVRYDTITLIRKFIEESPSDISVLISGRINYFDSDEECITAIGFDTLKVLHLSDFNEQQLKQYLKEKRLEIQLPDWFPTRPLLISYLVSKDFLKEKVLNDKLDAASGWDWLLDRICEREARLESGVDPKTIREIIEKLASYCRTITISNLGPISNEILSNVFKETVGYNPYSDKRALTLLQRLPGLSAPIEPVGETRSFIDENLVEVAAAGQVYKYILNPYVVERIDNPRLWKTTLSPLGISSIAHLIRKKPVDEGTAYEAIRRAKNYDSDVLACDILLALNEEEIPCAKGSISIEDVIIPYIEVKHDILYNVTFKEVIIKHMIVEPIIINENIPRFERSLILFMEGVYNDKMLNEPNFIDCTVERFGEYQETNKAILSREDLSITEKVAITILRKLYFQAGGGRQEKSLKRGLSAKEVVHVNEILQVLERGNLVFRSRGGASQRLWIPIRSKSKEIEKIVKLKNRNSELFQKLKALSQ